MKLGHHLDLIQAADKQHRTVSCDFDGVLSEWSKGDDIEKIGAPIPEGIRVVKELQKRGYTVMVFTARPVETHAKIGQWLKDHGIAATVTSVKVPSIAYLDDRGVHWDGDGDKALHNIGKLAKVNHPSPKGRGFEDVSHYARTRLQQTQNF